MQTMTADEHATAMAALRVEALRRGDPESMWVARLMSRALESVGFKQNGNSPKNITDIVNIRDDRAVHPI